MLSEIRRHLFLFLYVDRIIIKEVVLLRHVFRIDHDLSHGIIYDMRCDYGYFIRT